MERFSDRLSRLLGRNPRPEVDEELSFHLEMRARDYQARGMDPVSAREAAALRLGDLAGVRTECTSLLVSERRASARRDRLMVSWLDFRLGLRMLRKHPGLTVIGGLAMAFAIWVGAGAFEFARQVVYPVLPLPDGDRVVGVVLVDVARTREERRVAHDFARWREEVRTIQELGAVRMVTRNLVTPDGVGEPDHVAEMTATGFAVARTAPALGRRLVPADEEAGAPAVVVLGHDVWQRRFHGNPQVVGTTVRLGTTEATVVGVMPEGFAFPVAHGLWTALPRSELDLPPLEGPPMHVFGRLAPGVSRAQAQAELAGLVDRAAADSPETHQHLRPRVLPWANAVLFMPAAIPLALASVNILVVLLLLLICGNVALLMFARAASRQSEMLVRSALGASRGRIVVQLFIEALVLGALAAAIGLAAAGFGLRWLYATVLAEVVGDRLPFWMSDRLSPATIGYAVLLTLLAAGLAGVVPALKVTGRKVEARLREATAGGGGLRFGGVWTFVIVCQVAVTVAAPVFALVALQEAAQVRDLDAGIPAHEYLAARVDMDQEADADEDRFRSSVAELERRLESREGIVAVTFGERLPLMYHPHRLIEVDEGGAADKHPAWPAYRVASAAVATDFFDVLGVPILAGRAFHTGDLEPDATVAIVNESFVELVLGGRNPIGRHVQYRYFEEEAEHRSPADEPWFRIVGVVRDLGLTASNADPKRAGIYHPAVPGGGSPTHMAIHAPGADGGPLIHALRVIAADVDPALRVHQPMTLDRAADSELRFYSFWIWMLAIVCGITITLALAGIYAVTAFAVTQRTREVGIRIALGARPVRLLTAIFRRPMIQLALGIAGGGGLVTALVLLAGGNLSPVSIGYLAGYLLLMTGICLTACVVPVRRVLSTEPMEALRVD